MVKGVIRGAIVLSVGEMGKICIIGLPGIFRVWETYNIVFPTFTYM